MGSITRTINELLGVGPLNLEDALAGDITGIFAPSVRDTPYVLQASDLNVFDPAKARFARPKTKKEAEALLDMDDADEIRKQMEKDKDKLRKPTDAR
jgi:hypothetical protein